MKRQLLAVAAVVTVAAGGLVAVPEKHLVNLQPDGGSACVIPDCRTLLGRGDWDDSQEVDCRFVGPYSQDGGPVWRGCSVGAAEYAVGSECLPSACSVTAGVDPTELR